MKLIGYGCTLAITDVESRQSFSYIWECENAEKARHNKKAFELQGWQIVGSSDEDKTFTMQRESTRFNQFSSLSVFFADADATIVAIPGDGVATIRQYIDGKVNHTISSHTSSMPEFGIDERGPHAIYVGEW